ncbi:MFS transporter [Mesorhizobium sophorae]|uniref:MFS transporter n=1 Tax=Mesorhizobium sophorae TaxID=1300294 RepID=UPI003CC9F298
MSRVAREEANPVSSATFAPLESPTFRPIWLAKQVSSLGWLMQTVAISWLMATISTSDVMVALVQASRTLPVFILSIFAGAIADSFSRRQCDDARLVRDSFVVDDADCYCGAGVLQSMDDPRIQLFGRMRRRFHRPCLARLGR